MKNFTQLTADKEDYDTIEISHKNLSFQICYPCQKKRTDLFMGYFRIRLRDQKGNMHHCFGQLSISPPMRYIEGMKEYGDLWVIFDGLTVCEETEDSESSSEK